MMFIKQNTGLLRSVRSWGALGLVLALAVVVGYGQLPTPIQLPAVGTYSLPAGEMIGDIVTPMPDVEMEAFSLDGLSVSLSLTSRGEFTGRVLVFPLESLDAQPDPVNKVITADLILAQDSFSNAKPNITLTAKFPRPVSVGILVFVEKSAVALTYTISTVTRGVAHWAVIADDVKLAAQRGGGLSFTAPSEANIKATPPSIAAIACQGSVYSFNSSWWQLKTFNHDVCQQNAPAGKSYSGHLTQKQHCPGAAIDSWKTFPFNNQHLGIRIRMRNVPPRTACTVAYVVYTN